MTLLYWGKFGLGLILHVRFKCGLIVTVLTIMTWVSGSDFLASIQKGKDLYNVDIIVYLLL